MYKKISDYGIIGNLYSVSLIGLDGSIDWLCFPHIKEKEDALTIDYQDYDWRLNRNK